MPPERHGTVTNTYVPQVRPVRSLVEVLHSAGKTTAMFLVRFFVNTVRVVKEHL